TERMCDHDDAVRLDTAVAQILPCRFRVRVQPLFRRFARTRAVAAVVEQQSIEAGSIERPYETGVTRYVAGIAVQEQYGAGAPCSRSTGQHPRVQVLAVTRTEPHFIARVPPHGWRPLRFRQDTRHENELLDDVRPER